MTPVKDTRPSFQATLYGILLPRVQKYLVEHMGGLTPASSPAAAARFTGILATSDPEANAFQLAKGAEVVSGLFLDAKFVRMLDDSYAEARTALPQHVKEWVVKTGLRFPVLPGEPVSFIAEDDTLRSGIVNNLFPGTAEALVVMVDSLDERSLSSEMVRITAEDVTYTRAA